MSSHAVRDKVTLADGADVRVISHERRPYAVLGIRRDVGEGATAYASARLTDTDISRLVELLLATQGRTLGESPDVADE